MTNINIGWQNKLENWWLDHLGAELLVPLAVHLPHLRLLALQGQPDLWR